MYTKLLYLERFDIYKKSVEKFFSKVDLSDVNLCTMDDAKDGGREKEHINGDA